MNQLTRLEHQINQQKKTDRKLNLLIDILTEHLTIEKVEEIAELKHYAMRCLSIDNGRMMSEQQAIEYLELIKEEE